MQHGEYRTLVVICFKFSNFAYANTVKALLYRLHDQLLFALNLVTLLMQIQFEWTQADQSSCCYLL